MQFQGKTEREARAQILSQVREYCEAYHNQNNWTPGQKVPYGGRVYDAAEMVNLVDSALDFTLTADRYAEELERRLADFVGVRYCSLVNSGSSANLLAFMALTSPLLGERAIARGDEVITVAAGFPTTVAPIVQFGAVPVFVDVTIPQYNIDVTQLERALSVKTRAVMVAHTLGNPFDLRTVRNFCNKYDLWLIEDNCDALGAEYDFDGTVYRTGAVGDISTSSFYPPHHMTMGEGGAVYTKDSSLHKIIRSMRDWGRDCVCRPGEDNACGHRHDRKFGELPMGYDHKYVYSHLGYNLKVSDMQAAVGCAQMDKLPHFIERRRHNFERLRAALSPVADRFGLPEACPGSNPSWFGFLLTCREGVEREQVVRHLEQNGVQTRMLFAGNLIRHPAFDEMRRTHTGYRVVGDLAATDHIMKHSFLVGVYPGMSDEMIDYVASKIIEAVQ